MKLFLSIVALFLILVSLELTSAKNDKLKDIPYDTVVTKVMCDNATFANLKVCKLLKKGKSAAVEEMLKPYLHMFRSSNQTDAENGKKNGNNGNNGNNGKVRRNIEQESFYSALLQLRQDYLDSPGRRVARDATNVRRSDMRQAAKRRVRRSIGVNWCFLSWSFVPVTFAESYDDPTVTYEIVQILEDNLYQSFALDTCDDLNLNNFECSKSDVIYLALVFYDDDTVGMERVVIPTVCTMLVL